MNEDTLLRDLAERDQTIRRLQVGLTEILNILEPELGRFTVNPEAVISAASAADAALADTRDAGRAADDALAHVA